MVKIFENNTNIEKIISMVADNQKFAKKRDRLTDIVEKFSGQVSDELTEDDLEFVAAAKMPAVPKYKQLEK